MTQIFSTREFESDPTSHGAHADASTLPSATGNGGIERRDRSRSRWPPQWVGFVYHMHSVPYAAFHIIYKLHSFPLLTAFVASLIIDLNRVASIRPGVVNQSELWRGTNHYVSRTASFPTQLIFKPKTHLAAGNRESTHQGSNDHTRISTTIPRIA